MAFFPCTVGGGAEISESLEYVNDLLSNLGQNEYIACTFDNNFKGEVKTLTGSSTSVLLKNYQGVLIFDLDKITFNKIVTSSSGCTGDYMALIQLERVNSSNWVDGNVKRYGVTIDRTYARTPRIAFVIANGEQSYACIYVNGAN